jgi:HK97 family phage major capsid protein/HK97 family phage prohead protease
VTEKRNIPLQTREAEMCAFETRAEGAALQFALSSEAPVERFFGTEILSHEPGAVRMDRIDKRAMPLLFNHNWGDPVGMVDRGELRDGRLVVEARLFDTVRAKEVAQMLVGGLRNVSVGYRIYDADEDRKSGEVRVTDWEPYEASIVTIPADPSVGLGRASGQEFEANFRSINPATTAATKGDTTVSNAETAAAGASAEQIPVNVTAFESQRKQAILDLAKANRLDERYVRHWTESGASLDQVAADLLKVIEERGKNAPASEINIGMSTPEVRRYSIMRAIRAAVAKDWKNAGLELEAHKAIMQRSGKTPQYENSFFVPYEVQTRDLSAGTPSAGGYLVGTTNQSFIELLRNQAVVFNMGATRLSGLVGNLTVPKQTGAATAYWLADETTQITEGNQTFGQMSLTPKNLAALTEITHQLLMQSDPSVEALVTSDLAKQVALAMDVAAIRGSGNSGQPQGIVGTSGVGSVSGTSLAAAGVLEFQTDVAGNNGLAPGCGYVTTPAVAGLLMVRPELPTTGTERLWKGNLLEGTLFNFPARSSNQMATATMLFGHWPSVVIAEWGTLELMVNPYSDFTRGYIAVRAWYTCDVGLRYPASFSYASSIT